MDVSVWVVEIFSSYTFPSAGTAAFVSLPAAPAEDGAGAELPDEEHPVRPAIIAAAIVNAKTFLFFIFNLL